MEAVVSPLYRKARTAWLMDFPLQSSLIIPRLLLCKKDTVEGKRRDPTRQIVRPLVKNKGSKSEELFKSYEENKNRSIPFGVVTILISFSLINSPRTSDM